MNKDPMYADTSMNYVTKPIDPSTIRRIVAKMKKSKEINDMYKSLTYPELNNDRL